MRAGRPGPGILRAADPGNRELPRATGHGRMLRRRVIVRARAATMAVGETERAAAAAAVAMFGRAAVQHAVPGVPARIPEPGRGGGRRQNGRRRRRRRRVGRGIADQSPLPPSPVQLAPPAPLLFRQRHQPRAGRQFVHAGRRRLRHGVRFFVFGGQQQPRRRRRQSGVTVFVQLDRKYTIVEFACTN